VAPQIVIEEIEVIDSGRWLVMMFSVNVLIALVDVDVALLPSFRECVVVWKSDIDDDICELHKMCSLIG